MYKKALLALFFTSFSILYADNINIVLSPSQIDCKNLKSSTNTSSFDISINANIPYKIYKIEVKDPNDSSSKIYIKDATKSNITGEYTYKSSEGKHYLKVILFYTDGSSNLEQTGQVLITNTKHITCPGG